MTGQITAGSGTGTAGAAIAGGAGQVRYLDIYSGAASTAANLRWRIQANNVAESGSNAGSNLQIAAYDDSGSVIVTPIEITRSTGAVTLSSLSVSGTAAVFPTTAALSYSGTNVTQNAASRAYYASTLTMTNNCLLTITGTDGASGAITFRPDSSTSYTVYLDSNIRLLGGATSFVVTNSATETVNLEWKQTLRGGSSVILANKAVYP